MVKDLTELPLAFPSIVVFDKVDDVVICDNFIVLVVDSAFETNEVRVVLHSLFVFVYSLDDLGTVSRSVFSWGHKKCSFDHFLSR